MVQHGNRKCPAFSNVPVCQVLFVYRYRYPDGIIGYLDDRVDDLAGFLKTSERHQRTQGDRLLRLPGTLPPFLFLSQFFLDLRLFSYLRFRAGCELYAISKSPRGQKQGL